MTNEEIIGQGRGVDVEFIPTIENDHQVAQVLVSFANSKGGTLFIGIKRNGKISGVLPEQEIAGLDEVKNLIEGDVEINQSVHQIKHYLILKVKVEQSLISVRAKSVDGKWNQYVRIDSETLRANKIFTRFFYLRDMNREVVRSENHTDLLSHLKQDKLSLSALYKLSHANPKEIDELLSELIFLDLIDYQYVNESIYYFSLE